MSHFEDGFIDAPGSTANIQDTNLPAKPDIASGTNSPTSACRSSLDGCSNRGGLADGDTNVDLRSPLPKSSRSCLLGGLVCALFLKEDCRKFDDSENQADGEDALFCTLCNAEVCSCVSVQCYNHTQQFLSYSWSTCLICLSYPTTWVRSETLVLSGLADLQRKNFRFGNSVNTAEVVTSVWTDLIITVG